MLIYIILLLLLAIAAFFIKNKCFSTFCIWLLVFIAIFRDETVGIDTISYVHEGFSAWASGMRTYEFIYRWLSLFILPGGSYILVVTFGLITSLGIYFSSKRFGISPVVAFFFFVLFEYYNLSLNIARQYAAIGFLLIAYSYLIESGKKQLYFFLFLFLACGCHSSSIIFVITYFLKYINLSKIDKRVLTVILITIFFLLKFVLADYYLKWASSVELTEEIDVYSRYFEQATTNDLSFNGLFISVVTLSINIYVLIILSRDNSKVGIIISNLFFFSIIADIFFSGLWGNIGRLRYSINIINIMAFANYFTKSKDKFKFVIVMLVCLFYGYEFIYSLVGERQAYGTVPYKLNF